MKVSLFRILACFRVLLAAGTQSGTSSTGEKDIPRKAPPALVGPIAAGMRRHMRHPIMTPAPCPMVDPEPDSIPCSRFPSTSHRLLTNFSAVTHPPKALVLAIQTRPSSRTDQNPP